MTGTQQTVFGFTGQETDANSLLYLRARYYNPTIGQFVSLDPLEGKLCQPMSLNRYMYVQGNAVNAVDPSGMILERPEQWNLCTYLTPSMASLPLPFVANPNLTPPFQGQTGPCAAYAFTSAKIGRR